jgi:hypothetical protein
VKTRLRRTQYRPGLLDGFLAKTGLDLVTSTIEIVSQISTRVAVRGNGIITATRADIAVHR